MLKYSTAPQPLLRLMLAQAQTKTTPTSAMASGPLTAVPADEAYFWTSEWQSGVAKAKAEIAAGLATTFPVTATDDEILEWSRAQS
jgi:hypothetical protein